LGFRLGQRGRDVEKRPGAFSIQIEKAAEARRHVDCFLLTNDPGFKPSGRQKPDFAAMRYLRTWSTRASRFVVAEKRRPHAIPNPGCGRKCRTRFPDAVEHREGVLAAFDKPATERPLYPFNAEPIEEFVTKYKGASDVPLFQSKLVVPVIYINNLPEYLKEGSPFLRYMRETKVPFAILINYGGATAWKDRRVATPQR
jgi:hypothetical protein